MRFGSVFNKILSFFLLLNGYFIFFKFIVFLNCNIIFTIKVMMSNPKNNKRKKDYNLLFYFIATAIVSTSIVLATIKEEKRIKEENELLAYEVW